jgi:two-component system sensor histidine kinase KdpD
MNLMPMGEDRPNPDELLDRIKADEARAARGRLKIFFGASAGVGKTYAMLTAARQQHRQGVDVVVGVVETHGRKETEAQLQGLERLPLRQLPYRDKTLPEFDIDAALARKPALILIDELAHSNVAGSRHPKRWQDVEELLAAGIDVYSTVNVQHLETLSEVVAGITGIRVWETVPDHVFDQADEVVLVDLPPDELLLRLKEGKVYLAHQAASAVQNFFRKGNLIALRELALRRTADRVDSQMLEYRRDQSVRPVWQTRETLLACIGPGEGGESLVRQAARIADQFDAPWHAVYVETAELQRLSEGQRQQMLRCLRLAQDLGAETEILSGGDAAQAVVEYARNHNLSKLVVGRSQAAGWRLWTPGFAERLGRQAADLDIIQVARMGTSAVRSTPEPERRGWTARLRAPWPHFAASAALSAGVTLLALPLHTVFDLANIAMLFLLAVLLVAVRYGLGPSVMVSFLNVAAFDFFFVPPRLSFAVSDVQYLMTFSVMLAVGLLTSQLTTGLRFQARVANRREQRVRALYEMSRDLSGALLPEQIAEIAQRFARSEFDARCALLPADLDNRVGAPVSTPEGSPEVDLGVAQWAYDHASEAGSGTHTLPGSPLLYLPLQAPMRTRGVLAIEPRSAGRVLSPEQRRLLDTFARLIAISLERVHYVEVAQDTTVQMESERLRNSLLSAISHDLRTPLSALIGLAESFQLTQPPPTSEQQAIAQAVRSEAERMNSLVNNLLDMARLQSGAVRLNRQWQPLEEVIGSALRSLSALTAGRSVRVDLPESLPLLEFDAVLMERVFCNLVENAVKYTPAGSPISVGAQLEEGAVRVWVDDQGPGLPAGREAEIFEKFERGHKESTTSGVGLGLAICRAIIEAHGGRIWAEQRAQGSRFAFTVPCGQPPSLPSLMESPEAGVPAPHE